MLLKTLSNNRNQKGFTLIELLIVITIIATLAVTVFVALNPAQRLKDSKDARRTSDVDTILTAIHAAIVDAKGTYPTGLTAGMAETQLGTGTAAQCSPLVSAVSGCNVAASTACVNLMNAANPVNLTKYLKSMPIDPTTPTYASTNTGYTVQVDANGIVTVKACGVEGTTAITQSR